ncbi:MAG: efflux RND transporter periplasmic adaptor subunit [bacterium]|nr:efflux RND transporter periplasmic adaptor subunit [bacterium]
MKNTIYFISLLFTFYACSSDKSKMQNKANTRVSDHIVLNETQIKNIGITTGKLTIKTLSAILHANGKIEAPPQNMVSVSAPLGGYLSSTSLLPGTKIRKGEVIAVMEDQQYINLQQEYLSAKAKLVFVEAEYHRQKELNQSKTASDKIFQQAELDFLTQKIMLTGLSEKLKLIGLDPDKLNEHNLSRSLNMYSPINGYVSKVNVNIGKYLNPSDVLFELVNPEDIHLALTVFEKDISKLYVGQRLVAFTNNSRKTYPCEIILVGKNLNADRSLEVHCHFKDYDHTLIPGMYMNANIAMRSDSVYAIDEKAMVNFEGLSYVFLETGKGAFMMKQVYPGLIDQGMVEIRNSGQLKDKTIVVEGAYSLFMSIKNKGE